VNVVLSLFPGLDRFGRAFEDEGFCVVRGPDIILGSDIRSFKVPRGSFPIIIGSPPCKPHSSAACGSNNDADLTPEFERIIDEGRPLVFVCENVPQAPTPKVNGYATKSYVLDSHQYGANQHRERQFTFGFRDYTPLTSFPFVPEGPLPRRLRTPDPFPTVLAAEGKYPASFTAGHKLGRMLTLLEVAELMGFPELAEAWCFLPRGKSKRKVYRKEFEYELFGNGVERRVGRVIARAVRRGLERIQEATA